VGQRSAIGETMARSSWGRASPDSLRRHGRYLLLCGAAFGLAVISLSPVLESGFFGDDAINSWNSARSVLHGQGLGLGDLIHSILANVADWAQSGRFFPLSAYGAFLFYFVDGHPLLLKLFVLALILVDLGLLGYLATQITGSWALGVLAILITPLLFQLRLTAYNDPIAAFSGLLQVVLTYTLIALALLQLYLKSGKRRYLVGSLAVYAVSLLTYEIGIPFFLLFAALTWLYPERRSLLMSARISWPFATLAGAAVALNMGLRLILKVAFSGSADAYAQAVSASGLTVSGAYIPNIAPDAILATLAHQVSAALPLSFQQLGVPGLFPSFSADLTAHPAFYLVLIAGYGAMAVTLGLQLWREVLARSRAFRPGLLVVLGSGLLILPNALISLSPRYQAETSWGIGYLPVYLSYFGVALLILALIYGLFRLAASAEHSVVVALSTVITLALAVGIVYVSVANQTHLGLALLPLALTYGLFRIAVSAERRSSATVALAAATALALTVGIAYVGVVNHANNAIEVENGNAAVWYPRATIMTAMERGLLAGLPAGINLVIGGAGPGHWDVRDPAFFSGYSGVKVAAVVTVAKAVETIRATTTTSTSADGATTYLMPPQSDVYYLTYGGAWEGNGSAVLGRIRELEVTADGALSMQLEPARLYLSASTHSLLPGPHGQGLATTSPTELGIDPNEMEMVASGSEWSLFGTISGGTLTWVP
jgi:hypothetical protein